MATGLGKQLLDKMRRQDTSREAKIEHGADAEVSQWVRRSIVQMDKDVGDGKDRIHFELIGARSKEQLTPLELRKFEALGAHLGITIAVEDLEVYTSDDPVGYVCIGRGRLMALLAA